MTGELKMVYILKNLNLRKLCISFTICFIFIIIGITHVFADEKPTITQVVMDQDVGARLNEGDSVKMSVKADGATAVHAWITNKNSYHYALIIQTSVRNILIMLILYTIMQQESMNTHLLMMQMLHQENG